MTEITFSDISQWQPTFDADPYLVAGHPVIICRALSKDDGPDTTMPERRDYVRRFNFDAVGYYNRLNAERDPAQQAREFIDVVGELRDNEFPILDLEDGTGNQVPRAEAWFDVVDDWAGFMASLYSGAYFMRDNLGGTARWGKRPLWVADYTDSGKPNMNEATLPDLLATCDWWQFSCTHHFPGLPNGVDANIFYGTGQEFLARVRPGAATGSGFATSNEGGPVVLNHDGRIEVFAADGEVWHRWQGKPGQAFNETGWASLGQPSQGATMISTVINKDGRVECFVATKNEVAAPLAGNEGRRLERGRLVKPRRPGRRGPGRVRDPESRRPRRGVRRARRQRGEAPLADEAGPGVQPRLVEPGRARVSG